MTRLSRPPEPTGIARFVPAIDATRNYRRSFLRPDILAALTAWAMVVPEGIGYASIAGMPPEAALYAAVLGTAVYFLFGTSHEVTVGPSSALAIMSAATVAGLGLGDNSADWIAATSALAVIVGVMALAAGLLRLGTINNFISKPVLDGFVAGLALNIIIGQVPKLLGFGIDGDLNFFESVVEVVRGLDQTDGLTFLIGAGSYLVLAVLRRVSPKIPAALVVVAISVLLVFLFDLDDHGVAVIGEVPSGFPTLDVPDVDLGLIGQLLPGAFGMMVVAYAETLSGGRTFAARRHYRIDPDQEFVALGGANIAAGLFGGFTVNGSLSRTKLKFDVGVKTQYSTLFTGVAVAVTLIALTWFFEDLADATIAAIVIHAVGSLVRPRMWPRLWRTARFEFWAALAAALVTMTLGEVQGLFFGVVVAVFMVTARAAQSPVVELGYLADSDAYVERDAAPDAQRVPGVVVLRSAASPSFANTSEFHDAVIGAVYAADPTPDAVVLDCDTVSTLDVTATDGIEQLVDELTTLGVALHLARVSPTVLAELRERGLDALTRPEVVHVTVREAVRAARSSVRTDPPRVTAPGADRRSSGVGGVVRSRSGGRLDLGADLQLAGVSGEEQEDQGGADQDGGDPRQVGALVPGEERGPCGRLDLVGMVRIAGRDRLGTGERLLQRRLGVGGDLLRRAGDRVGHRRGIPGGEQCAQDGLHHRTAQVALEVGCRRGHPRPRLRHGAGQRVRRRGPGQAHSDAHQCVAEGDRPVADVLLPKEQHHQEAEQHEAVAGQHRRA